MAEYMVEGYKTPYKSIVKARAAAWRMYQQKKYKGTRYGRPNVEVKIFEKIAPRVYSEYLVITDHPWIVGAVGAISYEMGEVARLDSQGLVYEWKPLSMTKIYRQDKRARKGF